MKMTYRQGLLIALTGLLLSAQVSATTIVIVSTDGPGEGLNSSQPVAPVPGNNATTLGQQYRNVFAAAAEFWEDRLISSVPIRVEAAFNPLLCSASSAQLGGAGPINAFINFTNAPVANTVYVAAQANSLAGRDLDPGVNDVSSVFNSSLDGRASCLGGVRWWLGVNAPAPRGTISLYDTVLHEIGHGIGFLTFVGQNGARLANFNDAYMRNLFDRTQNRAWPNMTNAQRASSSVNDGNLVWTGANVAAGAGVIEGGRSGGLLRLFAPRGFQPGSSVSHWDTTLSPDELMEPFATPVSNGCATVLALRDMGWRTANECVAAFSTNVNISPILLLLLDE